MRFGNLPASIACLIIPLCSIYQWFESLFFFFPQWSSWDFIAQKPQTTPNRSNFFFDCISLRHQQVVWLMLSPGPFEMSLFGMISVCKPLYKSEKPFMQKPARLIELDTKIFYLGKRDALSVPLCFPCIFMAQV